MRHTALTTIAFLALVWMAAASSDDDDDMDGTQLITCGSVFRLRNPLTDRRLHSHSVTYGSGSGQQSVTGFPEHHDVNSLWIVRTYGGEDLHHCMQGTPITDGSEITLTHLSTGRNLHSHSAHSSPLSGLQEVSCFGENGQGDEGDVWILHILKEKNADKASEPKDKSGKRLWARGDTFLLEHKQTKNFLMLQDKHIYRDPIPGQAEICATKRSKSIRKNIMWTDAEGFFFPKYE